MPGTGHHNLLGFLMARYDNYRSYKRFKKSTITYLIHKKHQMQQNNEHYLSELNLKRKKNIVTAISNSQKIILGWPCGCLLSINQSYRPQSTSVLPYFLKSTKLWQYGDVYMLSSPHSKWRRIWDVRFSLLVSPVNPHIVVHSQRVGAGYVWASQMRISPLYSVLWNISSMTAWADWGNF